MRKTTAPLREAVAAMMELIASCRPDLLPIYLDLALHGPARFAILELAADFELPDAEALGPAALKISADLDRLEKKRGGWKHPRQVVESPNLGGLLYFCRSRIRGTTSERRRRRLEVAARKIKQAHDQDRTMSWITDFIGTPSSPQS